MAGISGLELVKRVKAAYPRVECIVMTAYADAKSGIEAMRAGALEYVAKPFEMDEMLLKVKSAVEKGALREEIKALQQSAAQKTRLDGLIGGSDAIKKVIDQAKIVAKRDTTVLIRGRSGTGKEIVARGIHAESGRKEFVAVNCGALPETLLESELFGYEKGAFTGAASQKIGLFEKAAAGTIFLDEIGDISPNIQVKLLRVLQEREFTRVGGTQVIRTGARVIAATNRNLEDAVKAGHFREDLYYRLNVFPINVPSLAERLEDIPALVESFLLKFRHSAGVEDGVMRKLMEYPWPGNVRELENCIERGLIMANGAPIALSHLPENIRLNFTAGFSQAMRLPDEGISLDELEKSLVIQALEKAGGNKTRAAKLLGISRRAMYSKMSTHGINGGNEEDGPPTE
jgi:DNA-binding NtrC family response regulator